MTDHKILIFRSEFNIFHFWSDFNKSGMFQQFQNYIQNFSRMHIAESPRLKSIFAIWGSGDLLRGFHVLFFLVPLGTEVSHNE